jgi:hypothetical protein
MIRKTEILCIIKTSSVYTIHIEFPQKWPAISEYGDYNFEIINRNTVKNPDGFGRDFDHIYYIFFRCWPGIY